MNKPILCLDFDGVIHSYTSGWIGPDKIPDPPVEGVKEFIQDALQHFDVQIYSSRSRYADGPENMRKWMDEWGLDPFHEIKFPMDKPAAFVTIDDRAITFTGKWPSIGELVDFKPWNKK